MKKTSASKKKWLEKHGKWVTFVHRDKMRRTSPPGTRRRFALAPTCASIPVTTLPVDCTGNATVSCPMDGNDKLGDCGPVMCQHTDDIRTFGQGKPGFVQCTTNLQALEDQYEQVSGGDNGTTEDMLVGSGGIWTTGLAGDPTAVIVDHLDFDVTNAALTQYLIDQFYDVCMAWSVPDAFLQQFQLGASFLTAMTPDPEAIALAGAVAAQHRVAVLTNNCCLLADHIHYLCPPVARVFGAQVYASASFGAAKPSPDLYRRCVAHLGVAPAEAFFIDDVEANVTGAIEAGLRAYRFTGNEALARELAYHRLL